MTPARYRVRWTFWVLALLAAPAVLSGCRVGPAPVQPKKEKERAASGSYPKRPEVAAPVFKVFHHTADSITLVTQESASDDQIKSLLWQLRDAAHARTLDTLDKSRLLEKLVDNRKPTVWFHIYRGTKCAAEKYAKGAPPCGGSYHAAGDFTYGDYTNDEWDNGVLLHGDQETPLWDTNQPYQAPVAAK